MPKMAVSLCTHVDTTYKYSEAKPGMNHDQLSRKPFLWLCCLCVEETKQTYEDKTASSRWLVTPGGNQGRVTSRDREPNWKACTIFSSFHDNRPLCARPQNPSSENSKRWQLNKGIYPCWLKYPYNLRAFLLKIRCFPLDEYSNFQKDARSVISSECKWYIVFAQSLDHGLNLGAKSSSWIPHINLKRFACFLRSRFACVQSVPGAQYYILADCLNRIIFFSWKECSG